MSVAKPVPVVPTEWSDALHSACAGEGLRALYQPLVDLQRGLVVGYEALIRFSLFAGVSPERWFAAARVLGCEAELEAAALATSLAARDHLPEATFLSVNVSPTSLASPPVAELLEAQRDLRGLVLELTEHTPIDSYDDLARHLDRYRARGALVAIDDAGAGYAGLAHMLELRPSILKLDRALVSDVDRDEAKRILVEMLGNYAGHLDAWLLAEGIETISELDTLRSLGVPLGQGWVLGEPAKPWALLDARATSAMREVSTAQVTPGYKVGLLLERVETVPLAELAEVRARACDLPAEALVVVVDERGKPLGTVTPASAGTAAMGPVTVVSCSTAVTDVAQRALTRSSPQRFEPFVCTDPAGQVLGIVRMERIIELLARAVASRL